MELVVKLGLADVRNGRISGAGFRAGTEAVAGAALTEFPVHEPTPRESSQTAVHLMSAHSKDTARTKG